MDRNQQREAHKSAFYETFRPQRCSKVLADKAFEDIVALTSSSPEETKLLRESMGRQKVSRSLKTYQRLANGQLAYSGDVQKSIEKGEEVPRLVKLSELFDCIEEIHLATGHARDKVIMQNACSKRYSNIPRSAIDIYVSTCPQCLTNKKKSTQPQAYKPILSKFFNERGQVDLIDMRSQPDGKFKWVLRYSDHLTAFSHSVPLEDKNAKTAALALLPILLSFGAPSILQSDQGPEFAGEVVDAIHEIWPECHMVKGRPRHPQSQGHIEKGNRGFKECLQHWMRDNNSKRWSFGHSFVTAQMNDRLHHGRKDSPYRLVFGEDRRVGISSKTLSAEILERLTNDKELEAAIAAFEAGDDIMAAIESTSNIADETEETEFESLAESELCEEEETLVTTAADEVTPCNEETLEETTSVRSEDSEPTTSLCENEVSLLVSSTSTTGNLYRVHLSELPSLYENRDTYSITCKYC